MAPKILNCGDDTLDEAARYLGGVLKFSKLRFEYQKSKGSQTQFKDAFLKKKYDLYILSDYPSKNFSKKQLTILSQKIYEGASLLMVGGWGSFGGFDGDYHQTPLKKVLPVQILSTDDRVSGAPAYRISKRIKDNYFRNLNFNEAPGIAGFNRFKVKKGSKEVLSTQTFKFKPNRVLSKDPLLVLGSHGLGRVACLATDLAPHWIGGLVDWGNRRYNIRVTKKTSIEVGEKYIHFVQELLGLLL